MNTQDSLSYGQRVVDTTPYFVQVGNYGMTVQYGSLLKIVLINQFICDFISSCQYVWMLTLLIKYQPSKLAQIFIWVVPFFIATRMKPYLLVYGKQSPLSVSIIVRIIILAYIAIVIGLYFIIVSAQPQRLIEIIDIATQHKKIRVLFAFTGWLLTKAALEIIFTFNEQLQSLIIFSNLQDDELEIVQVNLIAKINAYILCFLALIKAKTHRNYFCILSEVYYVCSLLAITGCVMMHNSNHFKAIPRRSVETYFRTLTTSKQSEVYGRRDSRSSTFLLKLKQKISKVWDWIVLVKTSAKKYDVVNAYYRLWHAPFQLKLYLIILASSNIMKFTIKFSCSMWIIESLSKDHNIGNHKYGQQIACVILSVFAISNFYIRKIINNSRKNWKNSKRKRIIYEILFLMLTILTIAASIVCIKSNNVTTIGLTVIICSLLISNLQTFLQFDQPSINRFHPEFQMCQNAVYNISHYATLLGIPLLVNFLTSQKSYINSFYFLIIPGFIIIIVKLYFLRKIQKKQKKDHKQNITDINMAKSQYLQRLQISNSNMFSSTRSSQPMSGKHYPQRRIGLQGNLLSLNLVKNRSEVFQK